MTETDSTIDAGDPTDDIFEPLLAVTNALANSELRPGQHRMARLVKRAIDDEHHLIVQAGTGTGKTIAYLVPAIRSGSSVVVATATKALQDQLATKDLPFLTDQVKDLDWAILKGRSNYLCLQRLREMANPDDDQLELDDMTAVTKAHVKKLAEWAGTSRTGDVAELEWTPVDAAWRAVSVSSDECPGAKRCPLGEPCFAEQARRRAHAADVVVVNTHLYGLDVAAGGGILPEHDVVVFDEVHTLEDTMSDTVGVEIAPGRFIALAATIRRIVKDAEPIAAVADLGRSIHDALSDHVGERLPIPLPDSIQGPIANARLQLGEMLDLLGRIDPADDDTKQRKLRAQKITARTVESLDAAIEGRDGYVAFVSGGSDSPRLEIAPLDVGPTMREGVWKRRTAILTSATIPSSLAARVGLERDEVIVDDVGSPFDYQSNSMLYCAVHLPNPNTTGFRAAANDELEALIGAAGGRTLALFTSYRAMDETAEDMKKRFGNRYPILTQRDLPKSALIRAFADDQATCLFATAGLFQGVDVPGSTLSLVVIDRIPFPRPDDPLLSARRDLLGRTAFAEIDVPRASMMLAQACGRLIRSSTDTGAVAVLDPRLGTAAYRWDIVGALPPMRRTRHRGDVEEFLTRIAEGGDA